MSHHRIIGPRSYKSRLLRWLWASAALDPTFAFHSLLYQDALCSTRFSLSRPRSRSQVRRSMSVPGENWDTSWTMSDHPSYPASQRDGHIQLQTHGLSSSTSSTIPTLPHRTLEISPPKLDFEFRMAARLKGELCRVRLRNEEVRDLSVVEGGEWVAGFGSGTVRVGFPLRIVDGRGIVANASSLVVTTCRRHSRLSEQGRGWTLLLSWRQAMTRPRCKSSPVPVTSPSRDPGTSPD